jgi:hypothetical protein
VIRDFQVFLLCFTQCEKIFALAARLAKVIQTFVNTCGITITSGLSSFYFCLQLQFFKHKLVEQNLGNTRGERERESSCITVRNPLALGTFSQR